jgi:hypothetical protein
MVNRTSEEQKEYLKNHPSSYQKQLKRQKEQYYAKKQLSKNENV